jgi:hypothetical protein
VVILSDQLTEGVVHPGGPGFLKPELTIKASAKAREKSVAFYVIFPYQQQTINI